MSSDLTFRDVMNSILHIIQMHLQPLLCLLCRAAIEEMKILQSLRQRTHGVSAESLAAGKETTEKKKEEVVMLFDTLDLISSGRITVMHQHGP